MHIRLSYVNHATAPGVAATRAHLLQLTDFNQGQFLAPYIAPSSQTTNIAFFRVRSPLRYTQPLHIALGIGWFTFLKKPQDQLLSMLFNHSENACP
ncbi:hypothetical protein FHU10_0075 [Serratia fonticola]|jgi:hypothetical protein|uniref:Uncharacterized protein n=1 Tax=Serratia fonticola TaxID=47917 RepID=A0A542D4Z9_SERFO|nr:hypothetical protein FHU09_2374 [Serratia fonticola]TQI98151.1 hypothetical protein FHU11_3673 [Serratia fonticola]TVZ67679.1 hypothetical protein FHU10_0075 [Serratia fonticola]